MKTKIISAFVLTAVAVTAISLPGCKKDDNSTTTGYEVDVATNPDFGTYLVDKEGYTLYFFADDVNGRNNCQGACQLVWPYFTVTDLTTAKLGPGLEIADFDTIHVNGLVQLRYRSWPLYYYAPGTGSYGDNIQEPAGQINGDGLDEVWFVAKPNYSVMLGHTQLVGGDGKEYTGNYIEGTGKTLFFTDPRGRTLYTFSKDSLNLNTFTKSDGSNNSIWPTFGGEYEDILVPSTLNKSLFARIQLFDFDGPSQMTYKGWPLYFFGSDNTRGNTKGVSTPTPGIWPVAVRDLLDPPVTLGLGYWDY